MKLILGKGNYKENINCSKVLTISLGLLGWGSPGGGS